MKMKPDAPALWALLAAAFFGASAPASKLLLGDMPPITLAGLLYLGAAFGVLPLARPRSLRDLVPPKRRVRLAIALVFGGIVGPVLLLAGLRASAAGATSIWLALETVFTAFIARVFFREHIGPRTFVALVIVIAASVIAAEPSSAALAPAALLVGGACLAWAIDNNLVAVIEGVSPARWTFLKGIVAGATNLAIGLAIERPVPHYSWIAALVLGAISYGLALVLYVAASQQIGAIRTQLVFATAPFFGVAMSWLMLGEIPSVAVAVAAGLLVVALTLMPRDRQAHRHPVSDSL